MYSLYCVFSLDRETYIVMFDVPQQSEFSIGTFSVNQRLEWSVQFLNGNFFHSLLVYCRTAQKISMIFMDIMHTHIWTMKVLINRINKGNKTITNLINLQSYLFFAQMCRHINICQKQQTKVYQAWLITDRRNSRKAQQFFQEFLSYQLTC